MPDRQDRDRYAAGGGLVAGFSENVADRLAALDAAVPRVPRARVEAEEPAGGAGCAAPAGSKQKPEDRKPMAPRKTAAAKKPQARKTPTASATRKAAAKKLAAAKAESGATKNGGSTEARATAFTGPTPGGEQKTIAQMLGEVTWLMTQSAQHKTFFLSDLEWLAMTPILLKQFRVFYATDNSQEARSAAGATGTQKGQAASKPIGVVLWARVNDEVEERLAAGNARLRPQDWRSGDKLWIVDVIAPFGGHDAMLNDLKTQVFKDRTLKFRAVVDGKPSVRTM